MGWFVVLACAGVILALFLLLNRSRHSSKMLSSIPPEVKEYFYVPDGAKELGFLPETKDDQLSGLSVAWYTVYEPYPALEFLANCREYYRTHGWWQSCRDLQLGGATGDELGWQNQDYGHGKMVMMWSNWWIAKQDGVVDIDLIYPLSPGNKDRVDVTIRHHNKLRVAEALAKYKSLFGLPWEASEGTSTSPSTMSQPAN